MNLLIVLIKSTYFCIICLYEMSSLPIEGKLMRVAIYCRLSREDDDKLHENDEK